ncbi:MAG: SDR family oxidoreductase [Candidatus Delongbacteria bacterium]
MTLSAAPGRGRPRVLLTGCNGRLGQHLLPLLVPDCDVLGVGVEEQGPPAAPGLRYVRLTGRGAAAWLELAAGFRPTAVLNAAAYTQVDQAEREREACWRANVDLVRGLLAVCRAHGAWLGQVSTDYVFDGTRGPYAPTDAPHARGVYARSKLAAENLVRGSGLPAAVVRTIVLFGRGERLKPDFFEWAAGELLAGRPIRVVTDQLGNCCWAGDLALALRRALDLRATGLYHAAARGQESRHAMALRLAGLLGADAQLVRPILSAELGQAAPRPLRGGLRVDETEAALGLRFPDIGTALESWWRQGGSPTVRGTTGSAGSGRTNEESR